MLKNYTSLDIKKDKKIQENFLNANLNEIQLNCNIYNGTFYLDTFNYFLINNDYKTFSNSFTRDINQNNDHYFTNDFFNQFKNNIKSIKEFNNIFVLGSNAANNYYSNLIQFLPRLFFLQNKTDLKIAIHRNSSIKFRNFIELILRNKNIKFSFIYLDDGFYKFVDSQIPEFLDLKKSIKILKELLIPTISKSKDKKIYVTREDSTYRKIINEADIMPILRSKGYKVINPQLYQIEEQIRIFSEAEKIIAPHGSNLSNIIFCKPGTEVYEIGPNFNHDYEKIFENRFRILAEINQLKYTRFINDTVPVDRHSDLAKKYINKDVLQNSNYYKNLIVKLKDIENISWLTTV